MRQMMVQAALAAVLAACAPAPGDRAAAGGAESGMSGGDTASSGTATGTGAASLGGILSQLELANTAEIESGKLAAERARSPEVKRIARQLVTEHTGNRAELEALAREKGADIVPRAGGSTARDTTGILALKGLEGAEFDSAYVAGQIEAHRTNLDAIRNQLLPAARDPDAQQYLQKTEAAMQQHLASLEQVQGGLGH